MGGEGGLGRGIIDDSKLKVPSPGQISIGGGILDYSKLKVPSPGQISILEGGGIFLTTQNSKSQVLAKFDFQGWGTNKRLETNKGTGKCKIISVNKVPPVGIEPGTSRDPY